jgi:hypothetical protein
MRIRRAVTITYASVTVACTATPAAEHVETRILGRAAYNSLPALSLVPGELLCGPEVPNCAADGAVAIGDSGYVAFAGAVRNRQVRLVGPGVSGERLIGREGAGPGEYKSVLALGFTPSGSLRVFDVLQGRVIEFATDGRLLATSNVRIPPSFITAAFVRGELRIVGAELGKRSGDSANVALYAVDPGQRRARKLRSLSARQRVYEMMDMVPLKGPFAASPQWSVRNDGGLVHSPGAIFNIETFDSTGSLSTRFGFAVPPRRVSTQDLDRWRAKSVRGLPASMQAAIRGSERTAAPMHAAVTRIRALDNGIVWAREAEAETGDLVRWVVFGADGAPRGTVLLEPHDDVVASRGTAILISKPASQNGAGSLRWHEVR